MKILSAVSATFAALIVFLLPAVVHAQADWTSARVQFDASGRLVYPADAQDNRIPDYSNAGYKGGGVPLPIVPVVLTISPIPGDNTANIQAAIDTVGAMAVQADGYRGTVLLTAGTYRIDGTIRLNQSGVVLSGVGNGADPVSNTILQRTGTSQATIIIAGSGLNDNFQSEVAGTRRQITTPRVPVGSRTFTVDDASPFAVGDPIIILHPSTAAWIEAMNKGGVTDANVWNPGEIDIRYHRYITAISGNTIAVDAPVFNHLERSLSQSFVYKYNNSGIRTNIGLEKLLVDIVTNGPESEDHATDAIRFVGAEDCFLRDATMQHFVHAGVEFASATRCTVERARSIEPHSIITGERRYNFSTNRAQLILFRDCFASFARHAFVTNGTSSDSGIVALNSTVTQTYTFAEAHRRWSTGVLFDSLVSVNPVSQDIFGFYNRGNYGTGHGWAAGHSVIWNCNVGSGRMLVQQPPTAQNYAIGGVGTQSVSGPFAGPPGYREGANVPGLRPQSLYREQLAQRLADTRPLDLTAPTAPTLTLTSSSNATVSLGWTSATDDIGVDGYNVFANGAFVGYTTGTSFTVASLNAGTAYVFTVHARDAAGNLSSASNTVTFTTPGSTIIRPPIIFEAEQLAFTAVGASGTIATETFSSGGTFASNFQYVTLGADGNPPPPNGEYIEFVLPNIPSGTYSLVLRYKSHQANRGIMQLSVDGQVLGGPLNQHISPAAFRELVFGTLRFATAGNHTVRLAVLGRDATAAAYTITADVFTLRPDNIAPVINASCNLTKEATGPDGAVVTYTGTATDDVDGSVPVVFDPPSGSLFALGGTPVVATAQDFNGNTATFNCQVVVVDTTPPALTLPGNLLVEASSPAGAVVTFAASAHDIVSGNVDVGLSHQSGSIFPLGVTVVTATAQDDFENVATGSFTVTVVDTTPPTIHVPEPITAEATSAAGASVNFLATATDVVSGRVPVSYGINPGSTFPLGTTTVTASATDAAGNTAMGAFTVTVVDTTAPVIESLTASPNVLWPPNHQLVLVNLTAQVADLVDTAPATRIISVASNESENGSGDGNTSSDWEITGALTLNLRAERAGGGSGRVYTITVGSRDRAGNASTRTVEVGVPH